MIELGQTAEPPVLETEARRIPVHRPVADERDIERAAALLTGARRLVIVAGDGAAASGAGPEVLALAEALAAPVATTLGARGIIPTTHRLSAGVAGSYSAPPANRIVHGAELVLFIGCDTGDQVTLNWTHPGDRHQDRADRGRPARDRPQLSEHDRHRRRPEGDARAARSRSSAGRRATAASPRRRRGSSPIGAPAWRRSAEKNTAPIAVERLCAEITRALPARRRAGRRYRLFRHLDRHDDRAERRRAELSARGRLARLGRSRPRSARNAPPGRARSCASPATAGSTTTLPNWNRRAAAGYPATVVINNNSGFGQNLTGVHRISGNRPGRGEELIRFGPTDFTEVAKSFGVRGIRVEQPERHRAGAAAGARRRRAGRRRCRHRSRTARAGSLVAAAARADAVG